MSEKMEQTTTVQEVDVNLDEIINIQDIILAVGTVLGNIELEEEQFNQADTNNDTIVDILDIVSLVNYILNPSPPGWSFEDEWTYTKVFSFCSIHMEMD